MAVNIILDGCWCPKCKDFHPTVFWHKKYDEYELDRYEQFLEMKRKRPQLMKDAVYTDHLPSKGLVEHSESKKCAICGTMTHFSSIKTGRYVCSDECKYKEEI